MKDVLISTQPKWVAKICNEIYKRADGTPVYEKEIELRKTRPKQEVPFRCLIYCTKAKEDKYILERLENGVFTRLDGKVIGEFICDRIEELQEWELSPSKKFYEVEKSRLDLFLKESCLSYDEICEYRKNLPYFKPLYGWHISNLKIYDKPKELSEFLIDCKNCSKKFVGDTNCWQGCVNGYRRITRPPQSWCYVEEV